MIAYIVRRLLLLPVVIAGVSILIFSLMQLMSPFSRLAVYITDPDQLKQGPEQLQQMVEALGLDDPAWVQYGRWMSELFHGNFGWHEQLSSRQHNPKGKLSGASIAIIQGE